MRSGSTYMYIPTADLSAVGSKLLALGCLLPDRPLPGVWLVPAAQSQAGLPAVVRLRRPVLPVVLPVVLQLRPFHSAAT